MANFIQAEKTFRFSCIIITQTILCLVTLIVSAPKVRADAEALHHDLKVSLFPSENRLSGIDEITVRTSGEDGLSFFLSKKATVENVDVNGRANLYIFKEGLLRIPLDPDAQTGVIKVGVRYQGIFNDPVQVLPVNTDNPGYGVTGVISENGSFLLSGAGWYPVEPESHPTFALEVSAPEGVVAVTAGKSLRHETRGKRTLSVWAVKHPIDGLSLSAARYVVRKKPAGRVKAMTYMLPESNPLSESYLDAVVRYLSQYETLFGPYPFDKFAVVENFFPTGYGFPSYTLLGTRVLRLPFILHTSLGHEIAHCWWGNGVYVDYAEGNWCEGLTTYVSDYRFKEMNSDADAREYRLELLRNYATLITPGNDFSLSSFQTRQDPVTKTIGYDKAAMVFHMLRKQLGEAAFWGTLRDIYQGNLFRAVSWDDLKTAFERRGKCSLEKFFKQWVQRKGAVQLSIKDVTAAQSDDSWKVKGHLIQQSLFYDVQLKLKLETAGQDVEKEIALSGEKTSFEIISNKSPKRLSVDPEFDIFRNLYPSEIPPSVNALKGSSSVLVVLTNGLSPKTKDAVKLLLESLGLKQVRFVSEENLRDNDFKKKDILLVGFPGQRDLFNKLPKQVSISKTGFSLNGNMYNRPSDIFFGVFDHPFKENRIMAVFLPLSGPYAETVARKITHYGKYSYLVFREGANQDKGTWPIESSPLVYEW